MANRNPVIINPTHVMGLTLPVGVNPSAGMFLTEFGYPADVYLDPDGFQTHPASYISMVTDLSGSGATIPVCRSCIFYDADGPFTTRQLWLGANGSISIHSGSDVAQRVGTALTPFYASVSLDPNAGYVSTSDLADLHDLLFLLTASPDKYGGIGEALWTLRETRTPFQR